MNLNLLEPGEGEIPLMHRLGTDVILLADVLFCLCKPQCDERNVTDEQFGQALDGAAFLGASEAFWAEYADFFRQCGRVHLVAAIEKQQALIQAAMTKAEQTIAGLSSID